MAAEFAVVTQITGQAWIRAEDGSLVAVRDGQQIPLDAVIITGDGSSVQLSIDGMLPIVVGANREFVFSADVVQVDVDSDEAALADDPAVDTLASLLDAGRDPFDLLESTAAVRDSDRAFYIHRSNLGDASSAEHVNSLVRLLALTHATLPLNEQTTGSTPPLVGTLADLFTRGLQGQSDSGPADLRSFNNGASPLFGNGLSFGGNSPLLGGNPGSQPVEPASARISINTIAGDGIVNATEARGNILISGDVGGDAKAGDIVRVTVGGTDYITQVQGGGSGRSMFQAPCWPAMPACQRKS